MKVDGHTCMRAVIWNFDLFALNTDNGVCPSCLGGWCSSFRLIFFWSLLINCINVEYNRQWEMLNVHQKFHVQRRRARYTCRSYFSTGAYFTRLKSCVVILIRVGIKFGRIDQFFRCVMTLFNLCKPGWSVLFWLSVHKCVVKQKLYRTFIDASTLVFYIFIPLGFNLIIRVAAYIPRR